MSKEKEPMILYDFFSEQCRPCQMMAPILKALKTRLKDRIDIVSISAIASPDYVRALHLTSFPSYVLVKQHKILWQHSGMLSLKDFLEAFATVAILKTK